MDRIKSLQTMIVESPSDVFLHYSLGMEHAALGQLNAAVAEFRHCIRLDSHYIPAYVEAGKALRSAGQLEEARDVFSAAMELAALAGESHMREFIQQQLDGLPKSP